MLACWGFYRGGGRLSGCYRLESVDREGVEELVGDDERSFVFV